MPGCSLRGNWGQIPIVRISRGVGWPTAAVMRRTCRLRPSAITSSSQRVAICCRTRTGGSRDHSAAGLGMLRARVGRGNWGQIPIVLRLTSQATAAFCQAIKPSSRRPSLSASSRPATYTPGTSMKSFSPRQRPSAVNWLNTPRGLLKQMRRDAAAVTMAGKLAAARWPGALAHVDSQAHPPALPSRRPQTSTSSSRPFASAAARLCTEVGAVQISRCRPSGSPRAQA